MIWHSSSPPCRRSLPPRSPPSRQAQGCGGEQSQAPLKENLIGGKKSRITHLLQKLLNHRLVCHKSPEVKLKVVTVHLNQSRVGQGFDEGGIKTSASVVC